MIIETPRLFVKPINADDKNDLKMLYKDIKAWNYLGGARSPENIETGIKEQIYPSEKDVYWAVRKRDGTFIGNVSLTPHHDGEYTEISYIFLSEQWGKGFAFEAVSEIVNYAFFVLNFEILVAETQSANSASCKLLQRLGFTEEKRLMRFNAEQILYTRENHVCSNSFISAGRGNII